MKPSCHVIKRHIVSTTKSQKKKGGERKRAGKKETIGWSSFFFTLVLAVHIELLKIEKRLINT
jgi:hypothetical protein